jgi:UDP-N-acetylmuramate--alanine ligase
MSNADVVTLFDRVRVGDHVVVMVEAPAGVHTAEAGTTGTAVSAEIPDPRTAGRFHYAGVGGSGMSALAQFQVMLGGRVSGSDRSFDRGERAEARAQLERMGIQILPQDGGGLRDDCAALVVSTAVESEVPDVAAARGLAIPMIHRSELLAYFVDTFRTVAVTGTSGKSTVVAMVFEILRGAGRRPSVITGGDLLALQAEGLWGNAWFGGSDLLVVEADESDGSVVRYHPAVGVVLNLQRDHKEPEEVGRMFARFREQVREAFVVAEDENLEPLATGAVVFGFGPRARIRGDRVEPGADSSRFEVGGVAFRLPVPGEHNVTNALAAIAACHALGVPLAEMAGPLAEFRGVGRRFQSVGTARGVEVVDDFAHNAAKIGAAIRTAQGRARRVLAVYQPHGFGPTRFLWRDLVDAFSSTLHADDRMWMLEVFYAGGTATRDFSAADIVADIAARGTTAEFAASREALVARIAAEARAGDLVLVMGARDPSLTALARRIVVTLAESAGGRAAAAGGGR